jgi:hypothetical protein
MNSLFAKMQKVFGLARFKKIILLHRKYKEAPGKSTQNALFGLFVKADIQCSCLC